MLDFYTHPISVISLPPLFKGMPKVQNENAASRNRTHDLLD
jgi:hypothetical protein